MSGVVTDLLVGVPALCGALCFLVASVSMTRVGDAMTRINVLSIATGLGMTFFVLAVFAHQTVADGFTWSTLLMALVSLGATAVVTTIASMTLARAVYLSGAQMDPRTLYDDLDG